MTPSLGIEPGPHWWEASALTTAPSVRNADCSEMHFPCGSIAVDIIKYNHYDNTVDGNDSNNTCFVYLKTDRSPLS